MDCSGILWHIVYYKTLYFHCILISRYWNVEGLLHFNLAFCRCSVSIYQAFDGQTEFSRLFNFAILSYSQNLQKFDAREKYVLQYLDGVLCDRVIFVARVCVSMLNRWLLVWVWCWTEPICTAMFGARWVHPRRWQELRQTSLVSKFLDR